MTKVTSDMGVVQWQVHHTFPSLGPMSLKKPKRTMCQHNVEDSGHETSSRLTIHTWRTNKDQTTNDKLRRKNVGLNGCEAECLRHDASYVANGTN